jgi:aryl-phospho-beta-D-glucosidase BglC (GH1 family)
MKRLTYITALAVGALLAAACHRHSDDRAETATGFLKVDGRDIITPAGEKYYIRGTNLSNWLNPEGYMFGFSKTNSPRAINDAFCQIIGPDATAEFWKNFKDNYITRADIDFIASCGANTVRLPFHYKLFTDEDYMGLSSAQDGFARIDTLVEWCRDANLHLILDMHDAPGGQTGDNIDDSYGYPWLMVSIESQKKFCDIWRKIAGHYKNEPVILGYELINEPVATHFEDEQDVLNTHLIEVMRKGLAAIREVDSNHIVLIAMERQFQAFQRLQVRRQDNVHLPPLRGSGDSRRHTQLHRFPRPDQQAHVYGRDRPQHRPMAGRLRAGDERQ